MKNRLEKGAYEKISLFFHGLSPFKEVDEEKLIFVFIFGIVGERKNESIKENP